MGRGDSIKEKVKLSVELEESCGDKAEWHRSGMVRGDMYVRVKNRADFSFRRLQMVLILHQQLVDETGGPDHGRQ